MALYASLNNNGTFIGNASSINITGTTNQNIGTLSTTGKVYMTKSANTATMIGDLTAGTLLINGSGTGTLALTSGPTVALNHTITGNVTITTGALKLTHSVLSIGGNFTKSGGTYAKGSGTVHFNGTSPQQSNVGSFNALRINNSNGVTLQAATSLTSSIMIGDSITGSILYDGGYQITSTSGFNLSSGTFDLKDTLPNFSSMTINPNTTVIYESGSAQKVSTIRGGVTIPYQNLTFSNAGTKTTNSGTLTILGNWNVNSPTALNTKNTVVNLTGNLIGTGAITSGSGAINIGGNWTNNGTFTCGSGTVNYDGNSGNQTAAGLTYHNLTINNSAGVTFSANAIVNTILTMTSGNVTTGADTLFVSNNATNAISHTSGQVVGLLKRAIATGANTYNFYIGTASSYAPVSINFASVTNGGNLTANVTAGQEPNSGTPLNTSQDVNLYWTLANSGIAFSSYIPTFTYNSSDIIGGAIQSNFIVGEYASSAWTSPTPVSNAGVVPYTTQVSGITGFGDFVVGDACTALSAVSIFHLQLIKPYVLQQQVLNYQRQKQAEV